MPVHVEQVTSDVTVLDGDLPLTEAQVERLVKIVLRRLEERQRESQYRRQATRLSSEALPPGPGEE